MVQRNCREHKNYDQRLNENLKSVGYQDYFGLVDHFYFIVIGNAI